MDTHCSLQHFLVPTSSLLPGKGTSGVFPGILMTFSLVKLNTAVLSHYSFIDMCFVPPTHHLDPDQAARCGVWSWIALRDSQFGHMHAGYVGSNLSHFQFSKKKPFCNDNVVATEQKSKQGYLSDSTLHGLAVLNSLSSLRWITSFHPSCCLGGQFCVHLYTYPVAIDQITDLPLEQAIFGHSEQSTTTAE